MENFERVGYANTVKKVGDEYQRTARVNVANFDNAKLIWDQLGFDFKIENNVTTREWIEGEVKSKLKRKDRPNLIDAIERFHDLDKEGINVHDWNKYNHNLNKIGPSYARVFNKLKEEFKPNNSWVVSHNDINLENMLFTNKGIQLIDFEWSNINHPLFDYVQIDIVMQTNLKKDKSREYRKLTTLTLIYFILWSFEFGNDRQVILWRKRYFAKLDTQLRNRYV